MKNRDDIAYIVAKETGFSLVDSRKAVDLVTEAIIKELEAGGSVRFAGFGVFGVRDSPETKSRDFRTGEQIIVPPKRVPFFKPGDVLKRRVRSS